MIKILKGTEHTEEFQPKPDQSGLLTDAEDGISPYVSEDFQEAYEQSILKPICKAQRDLIASIKDAEIEALIEEIKNFGIQLKAQGFVVKEYHEFITNRVKGIVAKYAGR